MQRPKVKSSEIVWGYATFAAFQVFTVYIFSRNPYLGMLFPCFLWFLYAGYGQILHVTDKQLFTTALVFPFISKLFNTKVSITDIQRVSVERSPIARRRVFHKHSFWDRLVLRDSLGRAVSFTYSLHEKEDILTFLRNIKALNPSVVFEESVSEYGLEV